ncbi:MAG: hypothetical protein FWC77_05900 [Defluviitaleaceae bacterium]|nr:hypothetical protein [Defluviitaleaceae bacterium]
MKAVRNFFKPSLVIVIVSYVVTCLSLYIILYRIYGGALESVFMLAVTYPIVVGVGMLFKDDNNEDGAPADKKTAKIRHREVLFYRVIGGLVLTVILVGVTVFVITQGDAIYGGNIRRHGSLRGYQILGLYFIIILAAIIKLPARLSFAAYYGFLLAATVAYLFIAQPTTVRTAQDTVAGEGYQNVSHITHLNEGFTLHMFLSEACHDARRMAEYKGVYLFTGYKNGADYGVFVCILSGNIVHSLNLYDNITLSFIIEQRS